jgi:hypothetical protein
MTTIPAMPMTQASGVLAAVGRAATHDPPPLTNVVTGLPASALAAARLRLGAARGASASLESRRAAPLD